MSVVAPAEEQFFYQDPYSVFRKGERRRLLARAEGCQCRSCILDPIDGSCVKCGHPASWVLFRAFRDMVLLPFGVIADARLDELERRALTTKDPSSRRGRENLGTGVDPAVKVETLALAQKVGLTETARQTGFGPSTIWRWLDGEPAAVRAAVEAAGPRARQRAIVAKMLLADSSRSDAAIIGTCGCRRGLVQSVRRELEQAGKLQVRPRKRSYDSAKLRQERERLERVLDMEFRAAAERYREAVA